MRTRKTFVGPRLRRLRREHSQTQAEMAETLGVSAAYVNLLENNQRSLSVPMLMSLSDAYGVDWRDLIKDESSTLLADMRNALQDPTFGAAKPDLQELRAAIDHAPRLVENFLHLYRSHRTAVQYMMRRDSEGTQQEFLESSPETIIHDFFRDHQNHFPVLEREAAKLRATEPCSQDDIYGMLKRRLDKKHGIDVNITTIDTMKQSLRVYDAQDSVVHLSEALDHQNRVFQLAHLLCLLELSDVLDGLTRDSAIRSERGQARCHVELANYFAAAFLMPYEPFLARAEEAKYDIDRIAASFGVSFEQVCHRLTTMQCKGAEGVPFFFLRVDKAGNVTKRFNSTTFNLAEYGGACPVWNIHTSFRTPGVIVPQFVELPDGDRFFTISRTTERPVFSRESQDRRLALSLGCELKHAHRIVYTAPYNMADDGLFSPIGINCHLCPRQGCSQRAHQPLMMELPIDTNRRGNTRYES